MITTVMSSVLLPYIIVENRSTTEGILDRGMKILMMDAWSHVDWYDTEVMMIIGIAAIWATLSLLLPGKTYYGPQTVTGFRPQYRNSGFLFYLISMAVTVPLIWRCEVSHLYPKLVTFGGMVSAFGLILSVALYVKGHVSPSPGMHGSSGNPIFDFYWGLELYPRFGPGNVFDCKTLINSRFGLWLWQVIVLWAWKVDYELHAGSERGINYPLTATTILQTIYLAKFYYWEDGYMGTIDISVDRFGYMLCWGCVAFVPTFFTVTSSYLIQNSPVHVFGFWSCVATILLGIAMILLTYEADRQRLLFRSKNGKCKIWGKEPRIIRASYRSDDGKETKQSLLLASGFWGTARHNNYAFELTANLAFALPSLFSSLIPYLTFLFLLVLMIHRSFRDDDKCRLKYGKDWETYCAAVPYRILPFIF